MSDAAERDWRKPAVTAPQEDAKSKLPLFVASVLGAALIGVLVWLLLTPSIDSPTRLVYVPLVINPAWPTVPFAQADFDRLAKHFCDTDDGPTRKSENAANLVEDKNYKRRLDELKDAYPRQPLFLYFTGIAVVWNNEVYLLSYSGQGTAAEIQAVEKEIQSLQEK